MISYDLVYWHKTLKERYYLRKADSNTWVGFGDSGNVRLTAHQLKKDFKFLKNESTGHKRQAIKYGKLAHP